MTRMPPNKAFDIAAFVKRVADIVRESPEIAQRAYAQAARRIRLELRKPANARDSLALQDIALQFDRLAAEARIPDVDAESGESAHVFADNAGSLPTEYDALVADIAASKVDEDGNPRTDLAAFAVQHQLQQAREREIAEPVQVTPASAKPGLTVFGDQGLVQYGGTPGSGSYTGSSGWSGAVVARQEVPAIRWEGREQETVACTIAFFRIGRGAGALFPTAQSSDASQKFTYRPYGRILWGATVGAPNEVYVDIGRGCQVTLATSFLDVRVGMDAPLANNAEYFSGSMMLGASMGFFSAARFSPVYRTVYIDNLAIAGTQTVLIPVFATRIAGVVGAQTPNFTFQIQNTNGDDMGSLGLAGIQTTPVPLPNDAYQILVTNNNGTVQSVAIVFELAL